MLRLEGGGVKLDFRAAPRRTPAQEYSMRHSRYSAHRCDRVDRTIGVTLSADAAAIVHLLAVGTGDRPEAKAPHLTIVPGCKSRILPVAGLAGTLAGACCHDHTQTAETQHDSLPLQPNDLVSRQCHRVL